MSQLPRFHVSLVFESYEAYRRNFLFISIENYLFDVIMLSHENAVNDIINIECKAVQVLKMYRTLAKIDILLKSIKFVKKWFRFDR